MSGGVIWKRIFTLKAGATVCSKCATARSFERHDPMRIERPVGLQIVGRRRVGSTPDAVLSDPLVGRQQRAKSRRSQDCVTLSDFALHTHLGLQTFDIPIY